jgi:RNA polymerase sigma factor (TIGR02999 family)
VQPFAFSSAGGNNGVHIPPMTSDQHTVTELLGKWKAGDQAALATLMPVVYQELRRIARIYMSSERADHTLQHTALVHEAYLKLADSNVPWSNRAHFFAVASQAMRRILVDYAKAKNRKKRGSGDVVRIEDEADMPPAQTAAPDILLLHEVLERLAAHDRRQADIVEMHYFGGMTAEEIAEVVNVSARTVERDLKLAKDWIGNALANS